MAENITYGDGDPVAMLTNVAPISSVCKSADPHHIIKLNPADFSAQHGIRSGWLNP